MKTDVDYYYYLRQKQGGLFLHGIQTCNAGRDSALPSRNRFNPAESLSFSIRIGVLENPEDASISLDWLF
ncbi:hypothetical protein GOP47_0029329 [Adiantum capillus-veneris]|nr:hypothetical protein GOP47_0029329 [Adiantum capillus-veneris]